MNDVYAPSGIIFFSLSFFLGWWAAMIPMPRIQRGGVELNSCNEPGLSFISAHILQLPADPVSARPKKETTKNKMGWACDLTYLKDTYPNHCKYLVQCTRDDLAVAAVPLVL
jgi:hypothetical protein